MRERDMFEMVLESAGMTEAEWLRRYDSPADRKTTQPESTKTGQVASPNAPQGNLARFSALIILDTKNAIRALSAAGYTCIITPEGELGSERFERRRGHAREEQKLAFRRWMTDFLLMSDQHTACALALLRAGWVAPRDSQTSLF